MNATLKYAKSRVLSCPNIKKIHNYSYYTDRVIGSGNFSTVYEAFSHTTHNKIAVKVVKMSSLTFKKLEDLLNQQIEILLTLNHMNTIKCFDVLKTLQECYIFTQFCDGGTLDHLLKLRGSMSEQHAQPFIKGIFEGLKYLNQKHIIHRDLKPANIFLKGDTVKIADFGFAVQYNQNFKDMNIGSPFYMSPEAFLHNMYGSKTDVWSFGITLYELLHGRTPFYECNDAESLKSKIVIPIRRQDFRADISFELQELIMQCLEIDQDKRISIRQIEQSNYMKAKNISKGNQQKAASLFKAQPEAAKLDPNRFGNHKIIRIPSKLVIKDTKNEKILNQHNQPALKKNYEVLKAKSNSMNSQSQNTDTSQIAKNPDSPFIIHSRPSLYRISSYKPKEEVKTITYECYLKLNSKKSNNNPITE